MEDPGCGFVRQREKELIRQERIRLERQKSREFPPSFLRRIPGILRFIYKINTIVFGPLVL